jgi:hypothetical protein
MTLEAVLNNVTSAARRRVSPARTWPPALFHRGSSATMLDRQEMKYHQKQFAPSEATVLGFWPAFRRDTNVEVFALPQPTLKVHEARAFCQESESCQQYAVNTSLTSVLVGIKSDGVVDVVGNALGVGLKVGLEQGGSSGLGQRERVWHLSAVGLLAKMAISNGGETNWVGGRAGNESDGC